MYEPTELQSPSRPQGQYFVQGIPVLSSARKNWLAAQGAINMVLAPCSKAFPMEKMSTRCLHNVTLSCEQWKSADGPIVLLAWSEVFQANWAT